MTDQTLSFEQEQSAMLGGYRAVGNLFRAFVDVLEARYGKEEAASIAREAVRLKGKAGGDLSAARFGRGGLEELRAAHAKSFPTTEVLESTPSRYVARDYNCYIVEGWRQSGVGSDRIRELADLYCWGDLHYARAFNPNIKLDFQARIAEGSPYCQWLFTLDEE